MAAGSVALAAARNAARRTLRSVPTLAAAGVGIAATGLMVYEWLRSHTARSEGIFWHALTTERAIALTFDDGPCHPYTEQLLEILDRESVQATFFMAGANVRREPSLAAEVASQHVVGNHTYTHPHLLWSQTSKIHEELERGQEAIQAATGHLPVLFRAPYGWHVPKVISTAEKLGLVCVGWSVMAWDWYRPPPEVIRWFTVRGSGPGGIALLHDGQETDAFPNVDRSRTVAAVSHIIRSLKDEGYGFATIPELMTFDAAQRCP